MIKACIFDCDGTLLDTLISIAYNANLALKDYGFPEIPAEEYKKMVGDGAQELIRRCLKRCGDMQCERFDEVYKRYREYFKEGCMYQVKPYDGIEEAVEVLKKRGVKTAVLSNKPHEQTLDVISKTFRKDAFDMVLGYKPEISRKPAPDGAWKIMDKFDVTKEECLYIGDTNTDMQTGNAAGMHTVGVLWGFRDRKELEENHAQYIIGHPREILDIAGKL